MRRFFVQSIIGLLCFAGNALSADGITIVEHGKPLAVITISSGASQTVAEAAQLLSACIEKSTNAKLPLERGVPANGRVVIHVGEDDYTRQLGLDLKSVGTDGFVITFPDSKDIVIAGSEDRGTEFGIYEFLERYVGVRWLMPGPYGEDIPHSSTITVSTHEIRQEPAYKWRCVSGDIGSTWSRRNRNNSEIIPSYHNLNVLFPPSKYAQSHPEFFPILNGKRYIPPADADGNWQPCFSADGIVEEASKNIKEYFRTHPDTKYVSLGMNDTNRFCECERCRSKEDPDLNFLGFRNFSDSYFEWANKVVENVLKEYPDAWFGALAYGPLSQPPKKIKRINPRIAIYMTDDRMRWCNREVEAEAHRITQWWNSTTSSLAWYDWIWGYPYMLPKVWFHQMAKGLDYGSKNGVRGFYAETNFYVEYDKAAEDKMSPFRWGEGPKFYLLYKLLWNPSINVDHVLDDWYERAVGKAAAPDLKAYFSHWEQFWTERIFHSSFWQPKGYHLNFRNYDYFDIVTRKDMAQSRQWLESAVAKAQTGAQKERAKQILKAFDYYEASALTFMEVIRAGKSLPASELEALQRASSVESYLSDKQRREDLLDQLIFHDAVIKPPVWVNEGDRWGCYPLWCLYDWARNRNGKVRSRLNHFTGSKDRVLSDAAQLMCGILDGKIKPITKNPDFSKSLDGWDFARRGPTAMTWDGRGGHDGAGALSGEGAFSMSQEVPVSGNNKYTCLGFVKITGSKSKGSYLDVAILDVNGNAIDQHYRRKTIFVEPGVWTPIATTIDFPALKSSSLGKWKEPTTMRLQLSVGGLDPGGKVYVDDCGIYMQEREGSMAARP
jgi:hypothetical protein